MCLTPVTLTSQIVETTEGFCIRVLLSYTLWKTQLAATCRGKLPAQPPQICLVDTSAAAFWGEGTGVKTRCRQQGRAVAAQPPQGYLTAHSPSPPRSASALRGTRRPPFRSPAPLRRDSRSHRPIRGGVAPRAWGAGRSGASRPSAPPRLTQVRGVAVLRGAGGAAPLRGGRSVPASGRSLGREITSER